MRHDPASAAVVIYTDASSWMGRRTLSLSWPWHWQNVCRDRSWNPSHRASPPKGPFLLDHRIGLALEQEKAKGSTILSILEKSRQSLSPGVIEAL
jgi:hypothetical protein